MKLRVQFTLATLASLLVTFWPLLTIIINYRFVVGNTKLTYSTVHFLSKLAPFWKQNAVDLDFPRFFKLASLKMLYNREKCDFWGELVAVSQIEMFLWPENAPFFAGYYNLFTVSKRRLSNRGSQLQKRTSIKCRYFNLGDALWRRFWCCFRHSLGHVSTCQWSFPWRHCFVR